ncbi:putative glutathione-S-transferase theta, GST [Annulohypoxylon truncatum]|uniref:putative glutathione-S-transferase theta, GST n=1 Tax=Annulohypoxylon truncatum TaxID=327061 RepID=UPI00200896C8|nr:putative glutathione-S-transferase theta, GST [Annulohypoxylon truncatum]KAI1206897.1 putative glutathione-S-transferase theta, GST [Annulohypoxylon truncatum]
MASVDTTELPARTTGAAAQLAAAHAAEHPLKLYGGWFCPFVQRAWVVLCEKRVPYQYVEINPYAKAPEFLALNPRGLVPTLGVPFNSDSKSGSVEGEEGKEVKRKPLYESAVICEYLDEAYDDATKYGPRLLPEDAYERARCRLWIDHISGKIIPGFYKFIQHTSEKEYSIEEARENFLGHIKMLVREMLEGEESGPWFLGDRFSLVDIMLAPWAKRLFLIDHYKPGGLGIPAEGQGGDDEKIWARWRKWFDAITTRQSVKDTWSDDEQYIVAYRRYAEDKTQSEVAKATRKGERLP